MKIKNYSAVIGAAILFALVGSIITCIIISVSTEPALRKELDYFSEVDIIMSLILAIILSAIGLLLIGISLEGVNVEFKDKVIKDQIEDRAKELAIKAIESLSP